MTFAHASIFPLFTLPSPKKSRRVDTIACSGCGFATNGRKRDEASIDNPRVQAEDIPVKPTLVLHDDVTVSVQLSAKFAQGAERMLQMKRMPDDDPGYGSEDAVSEKQTTQVPPASVAGRRGCGRYNGFGTALRPGEWSLKVMSGRFPVLFVSQHRWTMIPNTSPVVIPACREERDQMGQRWWCIRVRQGASRRC